MAALAGKGGKVTVATNAVAFTGSWDMSISDDVLDTTGLGATARSVIGRGLPTNTFSIELKAADMSDTGTAAIVSAIQAGTTVALNLYVDGTKYWKCASAYFTSFSSSASVDGLVTGSAGGTINGNPAYT